MTALEVYDLVTAGGGADFAGLIRLCEEIGGYCLIGGLAVDCYVEPVCTLDVEVAVTRLPQSPPKCQSDLRIQFTTDPRYQDFYFAGSHSNRPGRSGPGSRARRCCPGQALGVGRSFAPYLIRLAEAWPGLKRIYPPELAAMLAG